MNRALVVMLVLAAACRSNSSPATPDAPDTADAPTRQHDAAIDGSAAGDAGGSASAEIAAARAAADGSATLPIDGATITYVAPAIGSDAAGVFIQADQTGPALFIAVDPTTLTPAPAVGDNVSFSIADMATLDGQRRADAVTGWTLNASGGSVAGLVQDLTTATDVVTGLDSYDSELITISGTVGGTFASSAAGHVAAELDTTGITGNASLKLRMPTTVNAVMDLAPACVIKIGPSPMWRFNASAEPSAWVASDITVLSCPAPKVATAVATTATTVLVTFDRLLDPASVSADGSQFTFDQGLTATAAVVAGNQVTVTTAAEVNVTYTLTVANTIKDTYESPLDGTATTTQFVGFVKLATLAINEIDPNIGGSKDLVELLATTDGSINAITLVQDVATPVVLATLPNLQVAAGDIIVVHLNPAATTTTETTTKGDCTDATACFAGAWDVDGGTTGITFSNRTLRLLAPDATVMDAVAVVKGSSTSPAGYPADLQALQAAGVWLPADCGGAPCTYTSAPIASDPTIAIDWSTASTTATGTSVQRKSGAFTKTAADWTATTQTFGAPNN